MTYGRWCFPGLKGVFFQETWHGAEDHMALLRLLSHTIMICGETQSTTGHTEPPWLMTYYLDAESLSLDEPSSDWPDLGLVSSLHREVRWEQSIASEANMKRLVRVCDSSSVFIHSVPSILISAKKVLFIECADPHLFSTTALKP